MAKLLKINGRDGFYNVVIPLSNIIFAFVPESNKRRLEIILKEGHSQSIDYPTEKECDDDFRKIIKLLEEL